MIKFLIIFIIITYTNISLSLAIQTETAYNSKQTEQIVQTQYDKLPESYLSSFENNDNIYINFRNASLDSILDYLSITAGFIIIRQANIEEPISIWSNKPITRSSIVEILSTVLHDHGLAVIINERTLKIIDSYDAKIEDIDVQVGANPENIPKSNQIVHQIIPIKNINAIQLINNIQNLLPNDSKISANESSNAIIITSTLTNINRIAKIIQALDISVSEISEIKIFRLVHADANDMARVVISVFEAKSAYFNNEENEALIIASNIIAVADNFSNSLIINAASDIIQKIESLILEIDRPSEAYTEINIYPLYFANADEIANAITYIFSNNINTEITDKTMKESSILAIPDMRSNSVIVCASESVLTKIESFIQSIDISNNIINKIEVYNINNADSEEIANIITQIFNLEVIPVPDTRTNSVIAVATEETHSKIKNLISSLDNQIIDNPEIRRFKLQYADAEETAELITKVFQNDSIISTSWHQSQQQVIAVSDLRTNSIIISSSIEKMNQIIDMIKELDKNQERIQRVFIYPVENTNPQELQYILNTMFNGTITNTNR